MMQARWIKFRPSLSDRRSRDQVVTKEKKEFGLAYVADSIGSVSCECKTDKW